MSLIIVYITTTGTSGFRKSTAGPALPYINDPFAVAATVSAKLKEDSEVFCRGKPALGDCACVSSVSDICASGFARQICTLPLPLSVVL